MSQSPTSSLPAVSGGTPASEGSPAPTHRDPPKTFWGVVGSLGPGLIIAGSIVGSGELIATTKTGAQAGITLLWLIIIGCVIKVFVQVELGRFTISQGETTLTALNNIPGPKFGVRWIIWYWIAMMIASMAQLGGIVGGVGQSLAISFPITGDYARVVAVPSQNECERYVLWSRQKAAADDAWTKLSTPERERRERFLTELRAVFDRLPRPADERLDPLKFAEANVDQPDSKLRKKWVDPPTRDDHLWAALIGIITSFLLYFGRYNLIQHATTVMVVVFTFVTVGNVFALQCTENFGISLAELWSGLSFHLPPGTKGLHTALATFGIIGVGASELIAYPYWCVEKGYAQHTGPRTDDQAWVTRARGWIRVMQIDAGCSLVVYTFATLAFYWMGVAVLSREGRDPEGMRMVSTLSAAYVPIFGEYARWLFLFGAFAVLYSTYLVACAGHARTVVDALKICGAIDRADQPAHQRWLNRLSFIIPLICLAFFSIGLDPIELVLLSGMMQAIMLPMLAGSALYFRYTRTDPRLTPSPLWDVCLIVSSIGMLLAGGWGAYTQILKMLPS